MEIEQPAYSLASSQRDIWFDQILHSELPLYNIGGYVKIDACIDPECFELAVNLLVKKHDALRLIIVETNDKNGLPQQSFLPLLSVTVPLIDLSDKSDEQVLDWMQQRFVEPFELCGQPLFRYDLLKISENNYYWLMQYHHLITDGWSIALLTRSMADIYTSLCHGEEPELSGFSYLEHIKKESDYTNSSQYQRDRDYWQQQYQQTPPALLSACYRNQLTGKIASGKCHTFYLPRAMYNQLNILANQLKVSTFHLIIGILYTYFIRTSQQSGLVIGLPILNRSNADFRKTAGLFVGISPLNFDFGADLSFKSLVKNISKTLKRAYRHQRFPVSEINHIADLTGQVDRTQLFDLTVNYAKQSHDTSFTGHSARTITLDSHTEQTPLSISIWEFNEAEDVQVDFSYNLAYFNQQDIEGIAARFNHILEYVLVEPNKAVADIPLLPITEIQQLNEWNETSTDYPADKCIHQLFEQQVQTNPSAIALVFEDQQLTYAELNLKANQLAHYLIDEKNIQADSLVGICMQRSVEMVISVLAVLKAGGVYVPLDPAYPQARLSYMLKDTALETVITTADVLNRVPTISAQALCCDMPDVQLQLSAQSIESIPLLQIGLKPSHLAYVIYTSGSTGEPKGVMVEHGSAVALIHWGRRQFSSAELGGVLASTSLNFDLSVFELFVPLSTGGRIVLVNNALDLLHDVSDKNITLINTVPSVMNNLLAHNAIPETVITVNLAGEYLQQALVEQIYGLAHINQVYDLYGPSEDTTYSTCCRREPLGKASIGRPIDNTQIYILDDKTQLLPIGCEGELHIAGAGLARGYLNRAELSAEKFIANPFSEGTNNRLYKTGDLVRWLPDGTLEYLGRIDTQVKIRGFRIELGEIEATLLNHNAIKSAVVIAAETATGDKHLVAYIVISPTKTENETAILAEHLPGDYVAEEPLSTKQWREYLGKTLPEYMQPSIFIELAALPLTPNGKVDYNGLPPADFSQLQHEYLPAKTTTEKLLAEIWQAVLGLEKVGVSDNFFTLGGHSLTATRMISQVNQALNVQLSLATLFEAKTIQCLSVVIEDLASCSPYPAIEPVSRIEPLLLSYAQQRFWFIKQFEPDSAQYNMPAAFNLSGFVDVHALQKAFSSIVERHESLRTIFVDDEAQPLQVIQTAVEFDLPIVDLSHLDESIQTAEIARYTNNEASKSFDLSRDPMLRAQLLKLADNKHVLLLTMHHIASDGWSVNILFQELNVLYQAYVEHKENPLSPLVIHYADYAHWQRNWLQGEVLAKQLDYWQGQLSELPVLHSLPLDHIRPQQQNYNGASLTTEFNHVSLELLKTLCAQQGATLFMGLHAAFSVLLARYSNETDIVIGSPIANREQAEVGELIGLFINTLVLRSDVSGSPSFIDMLQQSKQTALDAYAHQQVPFEQLVEVLQPERSLSHSPLFQIMLVLQNNEQSALALSGLTLSPIAQTDVQAKFDLTLNVAETPQGLTLDWNYNRDLFQASSIERMAAHFIRLLDSLVNKPNDNVHSLEVVSELERHQQVVQWNDTQRAYPADKCLHQLFEQQVQISPDAIALVYETQQMTYAELNQQANQLAHYLISEKNVKPDTLVGICLERSFDSIIAMLAVLKAGGAYVPLDPKYPEARLAYMLADARLETVITHQAVLAKIALTTAQALSLDDETLLQQLSAYSVEDPRLEQESVKPHHLAYVIYTSGSTGQPKGVQIEHQSLVNYVSWLPGYCGLSELDGSVVGSSLNFDLAITCFYPALLTGKKVVLSAEGDEVDTLVSQLISQDSLLFKLTPSHLDMLKQMPSIKGQNFPDKQHVFVIGGEEFSASLKAQWSALFPDAKVINHYGPTEATVGCCTFDLSTVDISAVVDKPTAQKIPIGKPIANTQLYVVNQALELVSPGCAGELHIGGIGLARGYHNRPELTAEKFIANPFVTSNSARLYKTGDLVRCTAEGNFEFLGRIDEQVKIRGFRIELGEIENSLINHANVQEAVVIVSTANNGDKRIIAYIVADDEENYSQNNAASQNQLVESCRNHLSQSLPDYMVPSAFVLLAALPLTANGKLDRKALPVADISEQQDDYIAPTTATEKVLAGIWQDLLSLEKVGCADNFFRLGGHSLLLVQLLSRLQDAGRNTDVKSLFSVNSLGELATMLDTRAETEHVVFNAPENLIPADCQQLTPAMLPLVELDASEIAIIVGVIPGGTKNIQDIYPLAPLQQGILFHHQMSDEGSDPYITPVLLATKNRQQRDDFVDALRIVIKRHDALRTAVLWQNLAQAVQVVCRTVELPVKHFSLNATQPLMPQLMVQVTLAQQSFDLSRAPLLQVDIGEDPETEQYFILLKMHHIITDHIALEIILSEIKAFVKNEMHLLAAPAPYREFVAHTLHQAQYLDAEAFFQEKLGSVCEPCAPYDLLNVHGDGTDIIDASQAIPAELSTKIRRVCKTLAISPAVLFHSVFAMVVGACSSRHDVVFGTVVSGRLQGTNDADNMLGMFINTLPCRIQLTDQTAKEIVQQTQMELMALMPYEQAPLALAQQCSSLDAGTPMFTAVLNYRHSKSADNDVNYDLSSELGIEVLHVHERTNYPFTVSVDDLGEGFMLTAQMHAAIDPTRINGYLQTAMTALVDALDNTPEKCVQDISVLSEPERMQQLIGWNDTQRDYPEGKCIHQLFEQQVQTSPDAIALVFEEQQLTYGELNQQANQLAHYLVSEKNIQSDMLVGVCLERSFEMVIAILGIIKAGGAYVPLDPDYPEARLAYMLEDAELNTVITTADVLARTPITSVQALCLSNVKTKEQLSLLPIKNLNLDKQGLTSNSLAYVIYTSGSTGKPKGVMVEHQAIVNRIHWMHLQYGASARDVFLQKTPFSFDVSVWEFFWPLIAGSQLVLAKPNGHTDPVYLGELLRDKQITKLHFVPSMLSAMFSVSAQNDYQSVRQVFCSGEALAVGQTQDFYLSFPHSELHNLYGPTEAAVDVSYWACSKQDGVLQTVPIGRPIDNIQLSILDKQLNLVPKGVAGELHISGVGLARGYLYRPELTAEKFIANPFDEILGDRLYKTGDLVRWLPEGNLEYLGRIDDQVKIRGFRIELGEIENTLLSHENIQEAVVVAREEASGDKRLVAYLVSTASEEAINDWQDGLNHTLPGYMVPSAFVLLDALPLTPNGKVDRKALPAPDMLQLQSEYIAPNTETEKVLCALWQEILAVEQIGMQDNFFRLGGHSLLATQLLARINQSLEINLKIKDILSMANVFEMSALIEKHLIQKTELSLEQATANEEEVSW